MAVESIGYFDQGGALDSGELARALRGERLFLSPDWDRVILDRGRGIAFNVHPQRGEVYLSYIVQGGEHDGERHVICGRTNSVFVDIEKERVVMILDTGKLVEIKNSPDFQGVDVCELDLNAAA